MEVAGVVVAAGRSSRYGAGTPKQFENLGDRTVLERSVWGLQTDSRVAGVVVVLAPDEALGDRGHVLGASPGVLAVVAGGRTRAQSVLRGLEALPRARHVLVHDAARPLVSARVVSDVLTATLEHGAAVPALAVRDTVKQDDGLGFVRATLPRAGLLLAQTPQGARRDWLLEALQAAEREGVEVTDESAALERAGHRVRLVPGDAANVKITVPEDLDEARRLMGANGPELRVGTGFDVHRFGGDRPLVLGGVVFPNERGLSGHSDADVVLHAAMDALLGAACLGDIGEHFPPEDPRLAGADSARLCAEVARRVADAGFEVVNVDLTVLAERPRIRDRVREMRSATAAALGVGPERIGLKATTLEGLGALGRAEGIACQAAALLRRRR